MWISVLILGFICSSSVSEHSLLINNQLRISRLKTATAIHLVVLTKESLGVVDLMHAWCMHAKCTWFLSLSLSALSLDSPNCSHFLCLRWHVALFVSIETKCNTKSGKLALPNTLNHLQHMTTLTALPIHVST